MLRIFAALTIFLLVALVWLNAERSIERVRLGGGPEGGTFLVFSKGLGEILQQEFPELKIIVKNSGGSVANLELVEAQKVDLALTYAGDAFLGSQGQMEKDPHKFTNVRALGRVYGSTAQLVVLKESPIESPEDLANRRVAIGSSGSGAAHSAERYFRILGLWEEITPLYMGYDLAMQELLSGRAQAVWQLVGAPSKSIVNAGRKQPLRLIDLSELAEQSEFLLKYPFYSTVNIPAGTYRGQPRSIKSFQDNTLLVSHPAADPQLLTATLNLLFSPQGIQQMRDTHPVGQDLDPLRGLQGVQIPLHPVAEKFWRERGLID